MTAKNIENDILDLLKREVKPALGCTEPVAVALAVSAAAELLKPTGEDVQIVEVYVSANILKNGMGVGVPGTGMTGLHIAAALGKTCGNSAYKLEVLKDLDDHSIYEAKKMVSAERIKIKLADTDLKLYIKAICYSDNHRGVSIIESEHDNITSLFLDDKCLYEKKTGTGENSGDNNSVESTIKESLTVKVIYDFASTVSIDKIAFIMDSALMNSALAEEGLKNDYGLKVGKTIKNSINDEIFGDTLLSYAMSLTAAASDARMAGSKLPAMSNSGSGNQGIAVTLPVIATANKIGSSRENILRALVLSHLIAIHIKNYLGKLSALCGCVIASAGAACGIVYLKGGGYNNVCYAIKNMIGNIAGMLCDGAKVGCSLKVASGVSSAVQSSVLALNNICISDKDGIIDKDIEQTIKNLGKIGSEGMQGTDNMILDIMISK